MSPVDKKRYRPWPKPTEAPQIESPYPEATRLVIGTQPVREAIRVHGARLGAVLVQEATGDAEGVGWRSGWCWARVRPGG